MPSKIAEVPYTPWYENSVADSIENTMKQYRLARQKSQDLHVEIWTEKDAISGILRPICEKYGLKLVINKGYSGSTAMYGSYKRFAHRLKGWIDKKQKSVILYFGDHDPSGLDMVRDIEDRIKFMLANGERVPQLYTEDCLKVIHMGLTKKQIKELNPPPNPAKVSDPRADKYIAEHGRISWEVDALSPSDITKIVTDWVEKTIDMEVYEKILKEEKEHKKQLLKLVERSKVDLGPGLELIISERYKQIAEFGYDGDHDLKYWNDQLIDASMQYLGGGIIDCWPFEDGVGPEYKPGNRYEELTKAAAFIAAEIDRMKSDR